MIIQKRSGQNQRLTQRKQARLVPLIPLSSQNLPVCAKLTLDSPQKNMEMFRLEFCAECGSRLKPVKTTSGKQALIMLTCTKCGQKTKEIDKNTVKFNEKIIPHSPKQFVAVIDKEQELTTMPTIRIDCPRCDNNTANVWLVQTRGSDESSTQFLRCLRCGYTFREST